MHSVRRRVTIIVIFLATCWGGTGTVYCQISPAEISKANLKRVEQKYFRQLIDLNHAIAQTRFPFRVVLSRYPGLDPKRQDAADERGLEFIDFKGRVILKVSADYNAAFNAQLLSENQRANRTLDEVIVPILQLLPKYLPPAADFDGVGFEIAYHVRTHSSSYSYEGREVLTLVFSKADAFKFAETPEQSARQDILDASQVYVNGKSFGLMLGQRDSLILDRPEADKPPRTTSPPARAAEVSMASNVPLPKPARGMRSDTGMSQPQASPAPPSPTYPDTRAILTGKTPVTQADADALQTKLQAQLQALNNQGLAHDHFVDYAPPSFVIFRKQIYLQMTLRNPAVFDPNATSIYRRAARSFDLFLAPRLKGLLARTPGDPAIVGLDITVLTEFSAKSAPSSEAIEFVCPIGPLRQFTDADITNQDLINQSVVLVNGVRIALDLQQVE